MSKVGICEARRNGTFCAVYSEDLTEFKDEELMVSWWYCEDCAQSLRSSYTVELVPREPLETVEPIIPEKKKRIVTCDYCNKILENGKYRHELECMKTSSSPVSSKVDKNVSKWISKFVQYNRGFEDLIEGEEIEEE